ncbi:MAG: hypothetical protein HY975_04485 [Candidatus Kerfeldbacteria bacterium]|nr:hypothetical protein [Candidatus Kerfeldbacteria bacterium]
MYSLRTTITVTLGFIILSGASLLVFRQPTKTTSVNVVTTNTTVNGSLETISAKQQMSNAYDATLADLGATPLSTATQATINRTIDNQSLYYPDATVQLGEQDCGMSANNDKLRILNKGERDVLTINNSYRLVRTPNLFQWDTAAMRSFASDQTVICSVATVYPFFVTSTNVYWRQACSSGFMPAQGDPGWQSFVECIQAEEIVNRHFNLVI